MTVEATIGIVAAFAGAGGIGAALTWPWAFRKARADAACREAEARKTDAETAQIGAARTTAGINALTAIIDALTSSLEKYQISLAATQAQLDRAVAQSTILDAALKQARADLVDALRLIEHLKSRARQLQNELSKNGISIPKERRKP